MTSPKWLRVNPAIRSFILGEVERQYHPIGTTEYAVRVEWMTDAWQWALDQSRTLKPDWHRGDHLPSVNDILCLAAMIEPETNFSGFRTYPVWIGGREGAEWGLVPHLMAQLWERINTADADKLYLDFEDIHPFGDGNGRTGKVLHNWLLGTLNEPVLVHDYFGFGNP